MPFYIIQSDITCVEADVLVNAANEGLHAGGGVCGAIFNAAGYREMQGACEKIGGCRTGSAVVTPAFRLPAKWVVHAVGPIWRGGGHGEKELLHSCYHSVFEKAAYLGAKSVAFPLISAGIYGYPVKEALAVAREETELFLSASDDIEVKLVMLDRTIARLPDVLPDELSRSLQESVSGGLKASFDVLDLGVPDGFAAPQRSFSELSDGVCGAPMATSPIVPEGLDDLIDNKEASFSTRLLELIDSSGMSDSQVYKRANISRQLFSKIRSNVDYHPTKPTVIALSVALELDCSQTEDLLLRAGYSLSRSNTFDIIVDFYIHKEIFDVFQINEALFAYDQPLLGSI